MIEIKNLKKRYGKKVVYAKLKFRARKGEIVGITGESGSGKTTLLRIINQLEPYESGNILFDGKEIMGHDRLYFQRQMAMVFQKPALFNSSIIENVGYGLEIRGIGKKERENISKKILEELGLKDLKKDARKLSGGEAQRIALAQCLVLNPRLLLLDEPTANLDEKNIRSVEKVIKRVHNENSTIIISSHDKEHLLNICNRIYNLEKGLLKGVI